MNSLKIQDRPLNSLKAYDNNPRFNENAVEAVAESIREFGFLVPVVIDQDSVIVAGHTRVKAARLLGLDTVPCIVADQLTPAQIKAYRLADNKTAELATWDPARLQIELKELADLGFHMADFGFEPETVDIDDIVEDDFTDDTPPEEPDAVPGALYALGRHRLFVGDSLDPESYQILLNGLPVDLVLTDPPYNVDYTGGTEDKLKIENDKFESQKAFQDFLTAAFKNLRDNLKAGGSFYIFHATITDSEFKQALRYNLLEARQTLNWVKQSLVLSRSDYHWIHEPILYGWKDGAPHYFIDDRTQTTVWEGGDLKKMNKAELLEYAEKAKAAMEEYSTVLREDRPHVSEYHPTMKPIKLIARLMKNSTRPNEKVLDPFGGSGSTLIAAEQLGRTCYMIELDPGYADVIMKRYEEFTGEPAERIR